MTHSRTYHLSHEEEKVLDKFIDKNLKKVYIWESKSPMSLAFFFISKKNGKLQPTQDYGKLNDVTIKNRYTLSSISEIIDSAQNFKYFTALDLCWGYNNVCIKEGDVWKIAFMTKRGLFELTVMFFWSHKFTCHLPSNDEPHICGSHCYRQGLHQPGRHIYWNIDSGGTPQIGQRGSQKIV